MDADDDSPDPNPIHCHAYPFSTALSEAFEKFKHQSLIEPSDLNQIFWWVEESRTTTLELIATTIMGKDILQKNAATFKM